MYNSQPWAFRLRDGAIEVLADPGRQLTIADHGGWALRLALGAATFNARLALAWAGAPLALLTAIYTAFLFAQAKARDLWQSPLLAPHMAVHTVLAGAAALLPAAVFFDSAALPALQWALAAAVVLHLAFVAGELVTPHPGISTLESEAALRDHTTPPVFASSALTMPVAPCA